MLSFHGLSRAFHEGTRIHAVLQSAEAEIPAGASVAIVGRSGSGKSTLLHLIAGLEAADAGTVRIGDFVMTESGEPARTLFRRRHIGFIYQFFNLIPTLNVEDNVRLALELNGVRGSEAHARTRAMLARVGLEDRLQSAVDTLSGGEQQRVAIARALVHEPSLVLADEPTGNLDRETAASVFELLTALARERSTTLIVVTHDAVLAQALSMRFELCDGTLHRLP